MSDYYTHISLVLGSVTTWSIIGHAVQTVPTPKNVWGQWFIGIIQYAVGQKYRAANTIAGATTVTTAVPLVKG